ncbi:hypothetical protein CUPS4256_00360 [Campylobacter upsaliensis]|uniref:hypothetical protein n=1 Tax=Campylobacter upsaliensis TaxID=28080 RepID=UPI00214A5573|nr:hypothetical protein [Campylobacter upsaliensis]MCR2101713.1 hypothetical protein [Campylobacter upsaliensis]MCR2103551.1 hypothetical protein [Campylobacter upsaliensis]
MIANGIGGANTKRINKKHLVLEALYRFCKEQNNFIFHNDLVKEVSKQYDFKNK